MVSSLSSSLHSDPLSRIHTRCSTQRTLVLLVHTFFFIILTSRVTPSSSTCNNYYHNRLRRDITTPVRPGPVFVVPSYIGTYQDIFTVSIGDSDELFSWSTVDVDNFIIDQSSGVVNTGLMDLVRLEGEVFNAVITINSTSRNGMVNGHIIHYDLGIPS